MEMARCSKEKTKQESEISLSWLTQNEKAEKLSKISADGEGYINVA